MIRASLNISEAITGDYWKDMTENYVIKLLLA